MGFRPNTKGNPKQPQTGIGQAYKSKKKYIRKTRKMGYKKKTNTNAKTIASLLKRVRINELDKHGTLQTNKQLSVIPVVTPPYPGGDRLDVRTQYPVLFNINNFASTPSDVTVTAGNQRCPIFQMNGPTGSVIVSQVGEFQRTNYVGVSAPSDA